ncbi:ABC-three component system protein [Flavobacterium sp.]|uniref:ABC-three component system protein n=1 Tax=Flavobacterium sp. TaxID=239 RepID=UPI00262A5BA4|nr:ABC-three component system protein [Flavobacterium sp.]
MEMGNQDVNNTGPVDRQVNVNTLHGNIDFSKTSRLGQRFKKLKEEVEKDIRYSGFIDDFNRYNTELDGRSMPDKLADGGFSTTEIRRATLKKHQYSKKLEKNKLYETAQLIDLELFAMINLNFETFIEPLIEGGATKVAIKECVREKIIIPIFDLINQDGQDDTFLNYNVDDIYGMIFFLTGKCHLNWANYDNL